MSGSCAGYPFTGRRNAGPFVMNLVSPKSPCQIWPARDRPHCQRL